METKQIQSPFEIKQIDAEEGRFTGLAAVFGNVDSHHDRIVKGAFERTVKLNPEVVVLAQHEVDRPIGKAELSITDQGLKIDAKLSLGVQDARDMFALIKDEVIEGLSIGYQTKDFRFDENGVRELTEVAVKEVSPVLFPSNELAGISQVKNCPSFYDTKTAPSGTEWNPEEAQERIQEWAEKAEDENEIFDRAYLYNDEENEERKYLIADVVDERLRVVPEAVKQAVDAIEGEEELTAEQRGQMQSVAYNYLGKAEASETIDKDAQRLERSLRNAISTMAEAKANAALGATIDDNLQQLAGLCKSEAGDFLETITETKQSDGASEPEDDTDPDQLHSVVDELKTLANRYSEN